MNIKASQGRVSAGRKGGYASGSEEQGGGESLSRFCCPTSDPCSASLFSSNLFAYQYEGGLAQSLGFHLVPCRPCISWRGWDWGWPWHGQRVEGLPERRPQSL